MRVLASADHHFDEHSPRWAECLRVHDWMAELARTEGVDLFFSGGDIYERESSPLERQAVAEWLTKMAEVCPVVIAKGNHDRHHDVELLARLRTKHPIIVEERAGVYLVAGAAVAAVAWPDRAVLLSQFKGSEETSNAMREALQGVLRGLGAELAEHDGPRILLGHFMVDGAVTSTGQPLLGQPINVGLSDLALARADLGVSGHIHRAQRFDVYQQGPMYVAGCGPDGPEDVEPDVAPHYYVGSPYRTDFGQTERKTVLFATFEGTRLVRTQEVETPASGMVHLEYSWNPAGFFEREGCQLQENDLPKLDCCEVRFRYRVAPDQREAAGRAADEIAGLLRDSGATLVKPEAEVITERRARAPEVARAEGISEKLEAYWKSIGFDPDERREALLRKAVGLETEAREA